MLNSRRPAPAATCKKEPAIRAQMYYLHFIDINLQKINIMKYFNVVK